MIIRKNAFTISKKEQDAYVNGITALIADGTYGKLVAIHGRMMQHRMHSMGFPGDVGRKRFLPWHRAYLIKLEKELQKKEPDAFIPYWKWSDGKIPSWISAFQPSVNVPGQGNVQVKRNVLSSPVAPASASTSLLAIKTLFEFTSDLELGPHNKGHRDIGGPMATAYSPADPMFFMHHCQVDRLWSEWQALNPTKKSSLTGVDAIMDPWPDTVASLNSINLLGYRYA